MAGRLVAAWLILALCLGAAPVAPTPDPLHLASVMYAMKTPGVTTTVGWADCGQVNAYYTLATRHVTLCNELLALNNPGLIRFVLAHELAHGIIIQRNVPFTGSHETAADELAAVMLSIYGDPDSVLAAARWWVAKNEPETPWDDHPGDMRRGLQIACLAIGSTFDMNSKGCIHEWMRAQSSWFRLLGYE